MDVKPKANTRSTPSERRMVGRSKSAIDPSQLRSARQVLPLDSTDLDSSRSEAEPDVTLSSSHSRHLAVPEESPSKGRRRRSERERRQRNKTTGGALIRSKVQPSDEEDLYGHHDVAMHRPDTAPSSDTFWASNRDSLAQAQSYRREAEMRRELMALQQQYIQTLKREVQAHTQENVQLLEKYAEAQDRIMALQRENALLADLAHSSSSSQPARDIATMRQPATNAKINGRSPSSSSSSSASQQSTLQLRDERNKAVRQLQQLLDVVGQLSGLFVEAASSQEPDTNVSSTGSMSSASSSASSSPTHRDRIPRSDIHTQTTHAATLQTATVSSIHRAVQTALSQPTMEGRVAALSRLPSWRSLDKQIEEDNSRLQEPPPISQLHRHLRRMHAKLAPRLSTLVHASNDLRLRTAYAVTGTAPMSSRAAGGNSG